MTQPYLEHANVTVRDPEGSAALLNQLLGWKERWRGPAANEGFTIHVGDDRQYIAFYTGPHGDDVPSSFSKGKPLNHLAFVVDDLDAIERRVSELGYQPFGHGDYDPGRRFYFFDENGIEYEMVTYA